MNSTGFGTPIPVTLSHPTLVRRLFDWAQDVTKGGNRDRGTVEQSVPKDTMIAVPVKAGSSQIALTNFAGAAPPIAAFALNVSVEVAEVCTESVTLCVEPTGTMSLIAPAGSEYR